MTCALLAASWSSSALSKNRPNAIANELHHGRIVSTPDPSVRPSLVFGGEDPPVIGICVYSGCE